MKKFLVLILLGCLLVGCTSKKSSYWIPASSTENKEFEEFLTSEFVSKLETDYLNVHFSIKDYASFGIEKPEPILDIGDFDLEGYEAAIEDIDESLARMKEFDLTSLTRRQQIDFEVYKDYLENSRKLAQYPQFQNYFAPQSGLLSNLVTNFTEFEFRNKEDFDDYLSLLESVPAYIEEGLAYTEYYAKDGYFMTDSALDQTQEWVEGFVSKKEDNQLIISFENALEAFEGLSQEEAATYRAKNKDLVINSYIPSYLSASERLEALRGSRSVEGGLAQYEGGADYFKAFANYKASNILGVEEMINMVEDYIVSQFLKIQKLYRQNPDIFNYEFSSVKVPGGNDPTAILEFFKTRYEESFPKGADVNFTATYLDPSIANEYTLAYYLTPTLDDFSNNVIKINPNNTSDTLNLYSTLAHEGYPGHLYQITYYLNTNPNPIRTTTDNVGYIEGWAKYIESTATYWIEDLPKDQAEIINLDTNISYSLQAAVDLGVNGMGWNIEKTREWLDELGYEEYAENLYTAVLEEPGMIIPYGLGLVQFENLRKEAENKMKDKFNEVEFHEVILKNGDRPFRLVEYDVKDYINK